MKKKQQLPDHHPKEDTWDKLSAQMNLESQIQREIPQLPVAWPRDEIWENINKELDQRKKRLFWRQVAAAGVCLAIMTFSLVKISSKKELGVEESIQLTQIDPDHMINIPIPQPEQTTKEDSTARALSEVGDKAAGQIEVPKNQSLSMIKAPQRNLPMAKIKPPIVVEIQEPETVAQKGSKKTLHEVNISWGINDKIRLMTDFSNRKSNEELNNIKSHTGKLVFQLPKKKD